jgi:hypothetical protein
VSLKDIIAIVLAIIVFAIGFKYGSNIPFANHKEIIGFLITLSAIIFGVVGAWLSITKIEIQQGILDTTSNTQANTLMKRARELIKPLTIASLVLICAILFIFIQPILTSFNLSVEIKDYLRPTSFAIVSVMGYSLIYCLGCIILQSADFLLNLSQENQLLRTNRFN